MGKFEELVFHLMIVVVTLLVGRKFTHEFSVPKYAALATFFVVILLLLIAKLFRGKQKLSIYISLPNVAWFIFVAASFVSTIYVFITNRFYFFYSINVAFFIALTAILALYISNRFSSKELITRAMLTFVASGVVVAIDALFNYYLGRSMFFGQFGERYSKMGIKSTIGNPIFVANFMTMLLPIAFYFIFSNEYGWWQKRQKLTLAIRLFSFFSFLLFLAVDLLCQTRSEYIAMIVCSVAFGLLYLLYSRAKKAEQQSLFQAKLKRFMAVFFIGSTILVLWLFGTNNPITKSRAVVSRFSPQVLAADTDTRILAWLAAVEQWKESKLIGTGIGTYQLKAIDMMERVMNQKPKYLYAWENFKRAHNDYVQVLGETGLFGFGSIVLLAISLICFAFIYMKRETSRENLFMFLSLSTSFIAFMVQSFFSFPGQLMPNALLAIFVASAATGKYFNRELIIAKVIEIRGYLKVLLILLTFTVVIISNYLSWNYFLAEYNFKMGEYSVKMITEVLLKQKPELQELERIYLQKLQELDSLTGEFAKFRPERYASKGLEGEKQRLAEISAARSYLQRNLETIRKNISEIDTLIQSHEKKAMIHFLVSVQNNHTYGKSYFYLSSVALQNSRVKRIQEVLEAGNYLPLQQNFDEIQRNIIPEYRTAPLSFFAEVLKAKPNYAGDIALLQAAFDSCAMFKTSLKSFNERNTYKALATRYAVMYLLIEKIEQEILEDNIQGLSENIEKLKGSVLNEFEIFARQTVEKLPGSWNKYSDWKNVDYAKAFAGEDVYRLLAKSAEDLNNEKLNEFLIWISEKELWACENMAKKGIWAVPDGAIDSLLVLVGRTMKKDKTEAKRLANFIIEKYKESYNRLKGQLNELSLERNVEKYLSQITAALKQSLTDLGVEKKQIDQISDLLRSLSKELSEQLTFIDWYAIARFEVRSLILDGQNQKHILLSKYLTNFLTRYLSDILGRIITDQTILGKANKELTKIIEKVPQELLVWERINRFTAYYDFLQNNQTQVLNE